jgi:hypothetical protein
MFIVASRNRKANLGVPLSPCGRGVQSALEKFASTQVRGKLKRPLTRTEPVTIPRVASLSRKGRGEVRRLARGFGFLVIAFVASAPVFAADHCIGYRDFAKEGGRLKHLKGIDGSNMERALENVSCDRPACYGAVELQGTINRNGFVEDLSSRSSSEDDRPAQYAKGIQARLAVSKYAPPKLHGMPVCLKMHWNIVFGPSNRPGKV